MKTTRVELLPRKLPLSSYEVIRLPTLTPETPPKQGSCDQQPGTKRRKIMASVASQADKFCSEPKTRYPSFTKTLTISQVSTYFKMGIPESFCGMHLPSIDTSFLLENESGEVYKANYLAHRGALGRGWREICLAEKFSEGDVLVFQLVSPTKFKVRRMRKNSMSEVHRIRKSYLSEVNGAILNLDASMKQSDAEQYKGTHRASSPEAASGDDDHVVNRCETDSVQKAVSTVASEADEFQSNVKAKYPTFRKALLKSHVSGGFWMGLPQPFCRMHLPSVDTYFLLEYENGKHYEAKYLAQKAGLSGGWRGFSIAEKLTEGDVLVFQLVNSSKFKVHKIRSGLSDVNGDCDLQTADARVEQCDVETLEQNKVTHQASASKAVFGVENHVMVRSEDENVQKVETVKKHALEFSSGDAGHVHFPPVIDDHNGFSNFDDFMMLVDNFLKSDYNLPYHIKQSYYQLCSSQKSVLHVNLLKDINPGMVAGCIIETVDIANAMKVCELTTFDAKFSMWDRKLKSLELLGMNVGFLSARLLHLQRIASNAEAANNRQQYIDMCSEHADCENIIKCLQDKLNELRKLSEKHADNIERLKTEIKEHELMFQEQVSAPW